VRRLRALRELADRGTIAAAADAMHLTASAVSQHLAPLEREAGVRLIEPDGRRVRLTPAAELLLEHAGPLFAQLERLRAELDAHAEGRVGIVRIGAFPTAIAGLVAPAVRTLREQAPRVQVRVTELEAPAVFDALGRAEIDIAISMEGPSAPRADDARFHRRSLVADVLDAALPADHPLAAGTGRLPLQELARERWIAPPEGWSCDDVVRAACQAAGFLPRVEHRTSDWRAVLALVATGLGVSLVPRLAHMPPDGVRIRPVEGPPPCRHLIAVCRGGAEHRPAIAAALDAVADAATSTPILAVA
jgi:DNA-binding transcriptional LysR family regulator